MHSWFLPPVRFLILITFGKAPDIGFARAPHQVSALIGWAWVNVIFLKSESVVAEDNFKFFGAADVMVSVGAVALWVEGEERNREKLKEYTERKKKERAI